MLQGAAVGVRVDVLAMEWVACTGSLPVVEIIRQHSRSIWHLWRPRRYIDRELELASRLQDHNLVAVELDFDLEAESGGVGRV